LPSAAYPAETAFAPLVRLLEQIGPPGAGKDTWIHKHMADVPVIALDDIRRELGLGPKGNQGEVVMTVKARARDYLRRQQSFIWNAMNVIRAPRSQLIELFTAYHARVRIVYIEAHEVIWIEHG
jgi:predicted kinase